MQVDGRIAGDWLFLQIFKSFFENKFRDRLRRHKGAYLALCLQPTTKTLHVSLPIGAGGPSKCFRKFRNLGEEPVRPFVTSQRADFNPDVRRGNRKTETDQAGMNTWQRGL